MKKRYMTMFNVGLIAIVVIGAITVTILDNNKTDKLFEELNSNHHLLRTQDKLVAKIISKFSYDAHDLRESGDITNLKTSSGDYKIVATDLGLSFGINQVLTIGDSIYKKVDSDSIIVKKEDGTEYYVRIQTKWTNLR